MAGDDYAKWSASLSREFTSCLFPPELKLARPIHLTNLALHIPGLSIHALRLNRAQPEPVWTLHAHDRHGQLIIYLTGRGRQLLDGQELECRPGSVVYVPPGTAHAWTHRMSTTPLALVLDVVLLPSRYTAHPVSVMPQAALTQVKKAARSLAGLANPGQREHLFSVAAAVMEIMSCAMQAAGWLKPYNRYGDANQQALVKFMERLITRMDGPEVELEAIASHAGYTLVSINRKLKALSGLSLGQLRAQVRLKRAQQIIRRGASMTEAAHKAGFQDSNYFSRWFRQQTGLTPSKYRDSLRDQVRL